jgi:L-ascorbate metabolism protein UlaG (beta-lactamase superfamily)
MSTPAWAAPTSLAMSTAGTLRFSVIRHQTVLVEIDRRRVLFDPAFARGLGLGPVLSTPAPALRAEDVGAIDLLCVTSHAPGAFDPWATRMLRTRDVACLVADERTARALRGQGFSRVHVMTSGEEVVTRGVRVRAVDAPGALGPGLAFHLEHGARSFFHLGAPLPFSNDDPLERFARLHHAEVMSVCAQALRAFGEPVTFNDEDADALAALCRARVELRLGHDTHPSALGSLVLDQAAVPRMRARRAASARVVVPIPSTWYRVAPA